MLKFGGFIAESKQNEDTKYDSKLDGAGGGIISLMAADNVVNKGVVLCRASDDGVFSGGAVYIGTDGVFENIGIIDSGKDGMVQIECSQFVDIGQITPIPTVVMRTGDSEDLLYRNAIVNGMEELIKLEVVSHRGHDWERDIKYVLEEGTSNYYYSGASHGPINEDWFIFRLQTKKRFIPKRIMIRNFYGDSALKRISISGSDGDDGDFMDWIQIDNIRRGWEELQTFPVDQVSGYFAWERGFTSFRINVLDNYGGSFNALYEFRIYGVYCQ